MYYKLESKSMNRRNFVSLLGFSGLVYSGLNLRSEPKVALDENDPTAKALGYHEDHLKVDKSKWPKKAEDKEGKQICKTCILWVKGNLKAEGKDGEWGVCSIFPKGLVAANGWCNSWAPKQPA